MKEDGDKFLRTCLFADKDGVWSPQRLRRAFEKYTFRWLGAEWQVSDFRQALAAFFHEHISGDPARDVYSNAVTIVEAQAGRSVDVGSKRYGNSNSTVSTMSPFLLEAYSKVSKEWHRLIGQQSIIPISDQFILPMDYQSLICPKNHSSTIQTRDVRNDQLLFVLRDLFNNQTFNFKSSQQQEAVQLAANGMQDLLVILPTGGGKSLTYLLPLCLDKTFPLSQEVRCTVLICPFISLAQDVLNRCRVLNIIVEQYQHSYRVDEHLNTNLLIVNVDDAVKPVFWTQLALLAERGRLSRLVMDEAHVVLQDVSYRACFAHISNIRRASVPWLLLTATSPPKDESKLVKAFGLASLKTIRMSTSRPNIRYKVHYYRPSDSTIPDYDLAPPIATTVVQFLTNFPEIGNKIRDRIIVFCPTINTVNRCMEEINSLYRSVKGQTSTSICSRYDGKMSITDRATEFQNWRGGKRLVMVSTKAFGTGVDHAHVRLVLNYGPCDSLYDFAQQTGRAGRDGLPATSILFWNRHQLQTIQTKADDDYMAMKEWVQNVEVCRRGLLQWAMDADEGKGNPTYSDRRFVAGHECRDDMELCDICLSVRSNYDENGLENIVPHQPSRRTSFPIKDH